MYVSLMERICGRETDHAVLLYLLNSLIRHIRDFREFLKELLEAVSLRRLPGWICPFCELANGDANVMSDRPGLRIIHLLKAE
jgi:hypothetical protein